MIVKGQFGPGQFDRSGSVRDLRLDACRGLALCFTFIDHIPNNALSWLTMRNYGLSDAGEVFVFVSGYTCMISYGCGLRQEGWAPTIVRALRRSWEIYAAFLLLMVWYFATVWLVGDGKLYLDETNTGPFFQTPGAALAQAAALRYTPVNVDILPTFVLLHLFFPVVLWLMTKHASLALLLSAVLYFLVQICNWHIPAWPSGELYFNPLAWQFLFVLGAWCAAQADWLRQVVFRSRLVLTLASIYLILGFTIALSWQVKPLESIIPDLVARSIYPIDKSHLSPLRMLHFMALAYVVVRIIPQNYPAVVNLPMKALVRCGENALPIYCLSVLLSFLGSVLMSKTSDAIWIQSAITASGIAVMIGSAFILTWTAKRDHFSPKLF